MVNYSKVPRAILAALLLLTLAPGHVSADDEEDVRVYIRVEERDEHSRDRPERPPAEEEQGEETKPPTPSPFIPSTVVIAPTEQPSEEDIPISIVTVGHDWEWYELLIVGLVTMILTLLVLIVRDYRRYYWKRYWLG